MGFSRMNMKKKQIKNYTASSTSSSLLEINPDMRFNIIPLFDNHLKHPTVYLLSSIVLGLTGPNETTWNA